MALEPYPAGAEPQPGRSRSRESARFIEGDDLWEAYW